MIVFHGSLVKVEQPRILVPSHTLDYGAGSYTTTSYDQAEKAVKTLIYIESKEVTI